MDDSNPHKIGQDTQFEKLAGIDKRIDDLQTSIGNYIIVIGVAIGVIATIFGLVAIIFQIDFSSEKTDLTKFKKDIRDEVLGIAVDPPMLEYYSTDFNKLEGGTIKAQQKLSGINSSLLSFNFILKNIGGSPTGQLYMKVLTNDPLVLTNNTTVEGDYQYEENIQPKNINPKSLPVGLSTPLFTTVPLNTSVPIENGRYPISIFSYYGRDVVSKVGFTLSISTNKNYYHHSNTYSSPRKDSNIMVFSDRGIFLDGQDLKSYIFDVDEDSYKICFGVIIKNVGKSFSGILKWELFANKPLVLSSQGYEHKNFDYQAKTKIKSKVIHFNELDKIFFSYKILSKQKLEFGSEHPVMLKLSYKNTVSYWKFNLKIVEKDDVDLRCK